MTTRDFYEYDEQNRLLINFHAGQTAAMRSRSRIAAVISGTQGGKTVIGPPWIMREVYGDKDVKGGGPGDYLVATSNYDLFKLKLLPATREFFETILKIGRFWPGDGVLELKDPETGTFWAKRSSDPMWARLILRSAASEGGLESATAKAAWLDEAGQEGFGIGAWEAIQRRVALNQGRILITTTPYNLGWLKTQIEDRWRAGDTDIDVIRFPSTANPAFPQEEYDRAQRTLPTWKFNMFYRGVFERPEGLIFSRWDEEQALVEPFEIPADWVRYVGVDFGGVNTAMVWAALDPESKDLYLYDESLMGDRTVEEHAAIAKLKKQMQGNPTTYAFGGAASEEQWRRDFAANGFIIRKPPVGGVEEGLDRVINLMSQNRLKMLRGKCPQLREQINIYSRELDRDGNVTEKIANKEMQHFCDSLRYLCVGFGRQGTFFM